MYVGAIVLSQCRVHAETRYVWHWAKHSASVCGSVVVDAKQERQSCALYWYVRHAHMRDLKIACQTAGTKRYNECLLCSQVCLLIPGRHSPKCITTRTSTHMKLDSFHAGGHRCG
jgi:hypothetical protein